MQIENFPIVSRLSPLQKNYNSIEVTLISGAQLRFFKGKCQISITGHIYFYNFI